MKIRILLVSLMLISIMNVNAQWTATSTTSWLYSFPGTTKTTYTTVNEENRSPAIASATYTSFLPAPALSTDTTFLFLRAGTLGEYTLDSVPNALTIVASTNLSKFGAFGITGASSVAHMSFRIKLDSILNIVPTNNAVYNLVIGQSDSAGSIIKPVNSGVSNNGTIAHHSIFTILRILYQTSNNKYSFQFRSASTQTGATNNTMSGGALVGGVPYTIDIYCNDSTAAQNYTGPDGVVYTVAPASFQLWTTTNGVTQRYSYPAATFDLPRSVETITAGDVSLPDNARLNAFIIQSGGGTNQSATAVIDSVMTLEYVTQGALPISFITSSFTGKVVNKSVKLNWATASEQNNSYFGVLHSSDGISFQSIGTVSGNLNSSVEHNYSYTDNNPNNGINYYKLKQVDIDGKGTYTNTIAVNNASTTFSISPNPASNNIVVTHPAGDQHSIIRLLQGDGKVVMTQSISAGSVQSTLDISKLTPGLYYVVVNSGKATNTFKLVKE